MLCHGSIGGSNVVDQATLPPVIPTCGKALTAEILIRIRFEFAGCRVIRVGF